MFINQLKQKLQNKNKNNCNEKLTKLCLSSNFKDNSIFLSKNISSFSNNNVSPKIFFSNQNQNTIMPSSIINSVGGSISGGSISGGSIDGGTIGKTEKITEGKFKKILVDLLKSGYIVLVVKYIYITICIRKF